MKKKRTTAFALLAATALALAGCANASPLEAGSQKCTESLQYEIEQVKAEPKAGWVDSELDSDVTSHESPDDSEYAYTIFGTANVHLSDGTTLTVDWECFTQTIDGETYATIMRIDGQCSKTHREALEESGKTGCS